MVPPWELRKITILPQLEKMSYDYNTVLAVEEKNGKLFKKYNNLVINEFKDHIDTFNYAFGQGYYGTGILDIGTGCGVFLEKHLTKCFTPPRVAIDLFDAKVPDTGWLCQKIGGNAILEKFGKDAFSHVQCIETLEHVGEEIAYSIAKQMIDVTNCSCLITSMGIDHHLGSSNVEALKENEFLEYKGQPDIEMLMDLGYNVRLVNNYQILAWFIK